MTKGKVAVSLHPEGYNCAQCVLLTCSDLPKEIASSVSVGFGGGLRSGEVCGAISGGVMALGLKGYPAETYKKFVALFREKYGCVRCEELKPHINCDELIEFSADAVEKIMETE